MAHEINGFVVHPKTGVPVPGATITILSEATGDPIPAGGSFGATANPTTTDGNGAFSWSCELSPGPVRVRCSASGDAEVRIRSGAELMQVGTYYSGDIPVIVQALSSGVIAGILDEFEVVVVTGQRKVRVSTGAALAAGNLFSLDNQREYDIDPNPTLAKRKDYVVLNQWVGTVDYGKQAITIVKGTVNDTLPSLNTDPAILQIPLAEVVLAQNATTPTVHDIRPFVGPTALPPKIVQLDNLSDEVMELFEDAVGVGKHFKISNFNSETTYIELKSSDPTTKTLTSADITLPPGTWMIEAELVVHDCLCTVNHGIVRFELTGNGAPVSPDHTTRPIRFSGNVMRPAGPVASVLIVSPTVSTKYTVNATARWQSGDPVRLYGGYLKITAK